MTIPQPNLDIAEEILGRPLIPEYSKGNDCDEKEDHRVQMPVIAHRFSGLDAPENTLEALEVVCSVSVISKYSECLFVIIVFYGRFIVLVL